jgi:thioredoxin reductase (NADPH)
MFDYDADLLVLGAGPAGLTAAQYGARANLKTVVLEQMAPGGQALNIDVLENYPGNVGRGDRPPRSGFDFCEDLHNQAKAFGAQFIMEGAASVARVTAGESLPLRDSAVCGGVNSSGVPCFTVTLQSGKALRAPAVILATGAEHRKLAVPGEAEFSGRGVSYCATCDGPFFKGRRILVVGGGDAACDEAQYLSRLTDTVILIHRKSMFRAQKALAERTLVNPHITVHFNTRLLEIRGETRVMSVILEGPGGSREEPMDAVFIFAGSVPQTAPVKDLGLQFDEAGYVITDQHMETAVPGLFAAGDVRSGPFRQVVVAAGEGAVAAHCAAAYIDNLEGVHYH